MTEDDITRGTTQNNVLTGEPFDAVDVPSHVESVIASLPTGENGSGELWKLNHYYERLDDWNDAHGIAKNPFAGPAAEPLFEMHNLTADPEERQNRAADAEDGARSDAITARRATRREATPARTSQPDRLSNERAGHSAQLCSRRRSISSIAVCCSAMSAWSWLTLARTSPSAAWAAAFFGERKTFAR